MTTDTSIGLDGPEDTPQSGIDDEERERRERENVDGRSGRDLTSEDIQSGNDRNTSADDLGRSGKTNKLDDDGIELGR
ncbi:MAG: hypothetical protein ABI277_08630 [Burkholderiaceae bacterium]